MSKWKPRQSDIDWTRDHIRKISEGGKWVIPVANNSEITIYHSTKSYDAVIMATDPKGISTMMMTLTVLKEIGYLGDSIVYTNGNPIGQDFRQFQEDNT
jgi:hypothetical protein|tara:strand:- start:1919 stop:2215 length:297 start_codon:yes stop_codon:yes gene_type:complete